MCGIGGFVDYERDARRGGPILHGMKRTLTPRGPDAEGTYFDEDAALVHRRLIVIDPEGGKQPMHSPDRNTIIIYNGELYNTPELRTELMSRGHEFVGHSDTEVLLHAYLEWKTDAFSRLNGIFAFAIWEKHERRLTLCRDRLGVKPLFFAPIRNGLTFGSTIDTVLCHPEIEPVIDEDGLRTLLLLGPARPPESGVFRQIKSLLPGHFAVLTPENFTDHTYWRLEAHEHEDDLPTTIERTHTLICDAARRQLVSDVPLACFPSSRADWIRPSCPCWRRKITRPAAKRCTPGRWIIETTINILQRVYFNLIVTIRISIRWWIFSVRTIIALCSSPRRCAPPCSPRRMRVRCPAWPM